MDRLRECRLLLVALEREKCERTGISPPRVEEALGYALLNYRRLLLAKIRREGIELATDHASQAETFGPPIRIGPSVDD